MEKDEQSVDLMCHSEVFLTLKDSWIPKTRSEFGISNDYQSDTRRIHSYFEDTPIITVIHLLTQQVMGFPAYLLMNTSGQPTFPRFTNHFNRERSNSSS
jgi:omega-6 fatty acid desaturase (delta-12 desaturase)